MSWISRLFKNNDAGSKSKPDVESQPRPTAAAPLRQPAPAAAVAKSMPIGWTTAEMLAMAGGGEPQTWLVDPGYKFVFVLMPLSGVAKGVIDFDAESAKLRLSDASEIKPIGLGVCLDADFRGTAGQKLPSLLSTSRVVIRQQSGSCYAPVYVLARDQEPKAIELGGRFVDLASALPVGEGDPTPGGPERAQLETVSEAKLRDHVPFAHAQGSQQGFLVCEQPSPPGPAIVAAGSYKDKSVVVARMGLGLVAHGAAVRSQDISATLRDGSSVKALGMVVRIRMAGAPPHGWGDKLKVGPQSMSLEAGGTLSYMHDYAGVFSSISEWDCKVVAVFPAQVQLKELLEIVVGSERARLRDGTLIREG